MSRIKITLLFLTLLFALTGKTQSVTNGNFSSGTTGWACGAETNAESVYGGPTSNAVAEVDAAAGLCQTITGLTIGNTYVISLQASRRTGGCPSPAVTNVALTVSGGVLSTVITRTNTSFAYTSSSFLFTANATSHTITFAAGSGFGGSTCGMIIDNVSVAFSPLPVELIYFTGAYTNNVLEFKWETATEKNNELFELESSRDGFIYKKVGSFPSLAHKGNSSSSLKYTSTYNESNSGLNYYRLKQIDYDQKFSYSPVIAISVELKQNSILYPNPNSGNFSIRTSLPGLIKVVFISTLGEKIYYTPLNKNEESGIIEIKAPELKPGFYYCILSNTSQTESFSFSVY